ncbi:unnamed protein product [Caenorhabditis sp. 36 PRJEB53466]|nr:unnamed protein product [Caenorhabditis sp. 36 PRJEB53466]
MNQFKDAVDTQNMHVLKQLFRTVGPRDDQFAYEFLQKYAGAQYVVQNAVFATRDQIEGQIRIATHDAPNGLLNHVTMRRKVKSPTKWVIIKMEWI